MGTAVFIILTLNFFIILFPLRLKSVFVVSNLVILLLLYKLVGVDFIMNFLILLVLSWSILILSSLSRIQIYSVGGFFILLAGVFMVFEIEAPARIFVSMGIALLMYSIFKDIIYAKIND
ncbi:hypothetical protein HYV31_04085 [candidate division WWE3 bacterium]|nr:hypothetical protein [candidate division WWE3 bacterium]